ncbi:MAG: hydroxyethylthiazole kinase-like uncharacterized protein yjeF [Paraglaciecola sp.]
MQTTLTTLTENWTPISLSHKVFCAEQVRNNEQAAALTMGCPMFTLMERAGQAAFNHLKQCWPYARRIVILVGSGNNGGDGYIVAKLAKAFGWQVSVAAINPDGQLTGDAWQAQQNWWAAQGTVLPWQDVDLSSFDVIVDALLGTGLSGTVKANFSQAITAINQADVPVLSIDIPSGLHADLGYPLGHCVQADSTVTFVGKKIGLTSGQGKSYSGKLIYNDLGIGKSFASLAKPVAHLISFAHLPKLAPRANHAHKGQFGRLLCIGADQDMPGSIRMTSEAALRSGAGLVRAYCHSDNRTTIAMGRPELMLSSDNINQQLTWASGLAIGPGLGQNDWGHELFVHVFNHLMQHTKPLVIDADGLNILAAEKMGLRQLLDNKRVVLTPHPGEAARLLGCSTTDIEHNRLQSVQEIARQYHAVCVLKGAGTMISNGRHTWICQDGNPGMATGGMGDVLTGIIAALLCQGMNATQAALYGVCLHSAAADKVARQYGQRGMLATDLFDPLRVLINNP